MLCAVSVDFVPWAGYAVVYDVICRKKVFVCILFSIFVTKTCIESGEKRKTDSEKGGCRKVQTESCLLYILGKKYEKTSLLRLSSFVKGDGNIEFASAVQSIKG